MIPLKIDIHVHTVFSDSTACVFEVVKVAKEKEARDQGRKEGYEKGYAKAKSIYCFTFLCRVCREEIEVTDDNTKNEEDDNDSMHNRPFNGNSTHNFSRAH